jgi:hypothetical protein
MPYVKRDTSGQVVAASLEVIAGFEESVEDSDPQLLSFYAKQMGAANNPLQRSDLDLIRVIEDLVQLLLDKNLIVFTELPDAARKKLLERKALRREQYPALDLLESDDESL